MFGIPDDAAEQIALYKTKIANLEDRVRVLELVDIEHRILAIETKLGIAPPIPLANASMIPGLDT